MTNAPYLLPKMRGGARLGHGAGQGPHVPRRPGGRLRQGPPDGHLRRGLRRSTTSSRARRRTMFALGSLERAKTAQRDGSFVTEIAPVPSTAAAREVSPRTSNPSRPTREDPHAQARVPRGRHGDGREFLLDLRRRRRARLMRASRPSARAAGASAPAFSATPATPRRRPGSRPHRSAPSRSCWTRLGWSVGDVDLYEVNEAFAVVPMAAMRDTRRPARQDERPRRRLRARPSGRRVRRAHSRHAPARAREARPEPGVAALCIGGGEATAVAVEIL